MPRLSGETLGSIEAAVELPRYSREDAGIGHVHLGVGAFMRAHIAVYSDEAMNIAGGDWGIAGVSLRSGNVRDQLQPQDCLYDVAVCDSSAVNYRLIGSIKSIDVAPENADRIIKLIANPYVSVVTLTVTEKGYGIEPHTGALDTGNADIAHDLASLDRPRSTIGFLVAGLMRRRDLGAGPVTIISCDNLPQNGTRLRKALLGFVEHTCPDIRSWLDENVRFPETMVDRIVPATTPDDLREAEVAIGLEDTALVRTEPFTQWIIEDDFAGPRPAWDKAGALYVESVKPYELAKLRLLNGAHSALAYLGFLGGHSFIHQAMANPQYAAYARHLMTHEISPVTPQPRSMHHADYIDALLTRFRNISLRHSTSQIAMDGSQKLPQRLLNTIRAQLRYGGPIAGLSLAVAAWMRYALGRDERDQLIDVQDPLASCFADIASRELGDTDAIVGRFLQIESVFGNDLASEPKFTSMVTKYLAGLLRQGAARTVADFVAGCGR